MISLKVGKLNFFVYGNFFFGGGGGISRPSATIKASCPSLLVGQLVGWLVLVGRSGMIFRKGGGSNTSMLLSDYLF